MAGHDGKYINFQPCWRYVRSLTLTVNPVILITTKCIFSHCSGPYGSYYISSWAPDRLSPASNLSRKLRPADSCSNSYVIRHISESIFEGMSYDVNSYRHH